ncbi:MAG: hypothetical protein FWH03_06250 [Firmicutes bacterium]|nr:hypothetical protein [Bacillota bacterium]
MNIKKLEKAKEIFTLYYGDEYVMQRNGGYSEYIKFRIPKEIEQTWREEQKTRIKSELSCAIPSKFLSLVNEYELYVKGLGNGDDFIIGYLYDNYLRFDSFTNLNSCEIIKGHRRVWEDSSQKKIVAILNHILSSNLVIHECYKAPLFHGFDFSETALKERAQKVLNEIM